MRYTDLIENARKARAKGNFREAIKYYQEAFTKKIIIKDLVDYGLVHLDNNQPIQAIEVFNEVVEVFPDLPHIYYYLGLAHEIIGKKDEAIKYYHTAVAKDPSFADAYFSLALLADESDNEDLAIHYYKKTLLYNPHHFWANLNLGSFYEKRNQLDLALAHTRQAYRIDPKQKMVSYNLGVIYGKQKKFAEAKKYYLEEIEKDGYILAYLNIALIYKDIYRDYESARYYYLAGISKDKDNAVLWYNLACVYLLSNDYENCYSCLLYAIMRDPSLKEFMLEDEELTDFIKSPYYEKLMKEIG